MGGIVLGIIVIAALLLAINSFKIIGQAEVMVVERLGRFNRIARSGFNVVLPFLERTKTRQSARCGRPCRPVAPNCPRWAWPSRSSKR